MDPNSVLSPTYAFSPSNPLSPTNPSGLLNPLNANSPLSPLNPANQGSSRAALEGGGDVPGWMAGLLALFFAGLFLWMIVSIIWILVADFIDGRRNRAILREMRAVGQGTRK